MSEKPLAMRIAKPFRCFATWLGCALMLLPGPLVLGQTPGTWDTTQPRGNTRDIDFTTNEGTWMSVDTSPDGRWVVFDMLAHIYRVPIQGGPAQCLTQNSGLATNFHPRFSPDGKLIAFVSDRKGQDNLWIMDADGANPRPVFMDKNVRVFEPAWTPDGKYIIVKRHRMGEGLFVTSGLWMYHRDGGDGIQLKGPEELGRLVGWPAVSADQKYVYFDACSKETGDGCGSLLFGSLQVWRLELGTGDLTEVTNGRGGGFAPEVSPDGRWLAYAKRVPDGTVSYKGHKFSPRTVLWLRDLQTGKEKIVLDPIEIDLAERTLGGRAVFNAERPLPGYAWARDGKSIVISQGGKLKRVWVETGTVDPIPFSVHVHRTISEQAYSTLDLSQPDFKSRAIYWQTASPDGSKLAFQAVGKIWIQTLPRGTPRRLTPDSFAPLEYSPTWSPDGSSIAFTSWDDGKRGQVWRIAINGGDPQQLTQEPGEYLNPAWSPDGHDIIMTTGAGVTARGLAMFENPYYELVDIPSSGGKAKFIARLNPPREYYGGGQIWQASFGPGGRLFYPDSKFIYAGAGREHLKHPQAAGISDAAGLRPWTGAFEGVITQLISAKPDGSDKRVVAELPYATAVAPSPDGKWIAFQEGDNVYLAPLPWNASASLPVRIDPRKRDLPVRRLSLEGGQFPHWLDATTLEFGTANRYFVYHTATDKIDTINIDLTVHRNMATGRVALVGAKIITIDNRKVIENGTILVQNARITCVGQCNTTGVDRIVDLRGKSVIPGLIDMHAHHHGIHYGLLPRHDFINAIYMSYGVTTTMDPWTWAQDVFSSAELIDSGQTIGPRTFSSGMGIWSGDSPYHNEITSYEDAEHEVKRLASWGAITMKQYTLPTREQRQWVTEAARKLGVKVTAEGEDNVYDLGMIMDGHTGFEHNAGYVPLYQDVTKFIAQARAVYSATIIVVGPDSAYGDQYFYQQSDVWRDPKLRQWEPWDFLIPGVRERTLRPVTDYGFPLLAQGVADVRAYGGFGTIGSHGQYHGIGSHWEVWMMATAMDPISALEVATMDGAHFLGAEKDLGSISVGKIADLVILNSNPLDNIRNTADIQYVMKAGVLYDAKTLDQVWPRHEAYGDHYWVNGEQLRDDNRSIDSPQP